MWPIREFSDSIVSIKHLETSEDIRSTNKYIEIDNVRIIPEKITFNDVFNGTKYNKDIVIQNFGNNMAYVTVFSPTSIVSKKFKKKMSMG